jgi:uncharacterized delta-60 repeat protein
MVRTWLRRWLARPWSQAVPGGRAAGRRTACVRPRLEELETRTLLSAGVLDSTFGVGGRVVTDFFQSSDRVRALAVQGDGKIVAVGEMVVGGDAQFAVARYLPGGGLDPQFGISGMNFINFGGQEDAATAVAVQGDGKIVVAGFTLDQSGNADFALVRLTDSGGLDPDFGNMGRVTLDFAGGPDAATGVLLQGDKILVGGGAVLNGPSDFALARFNADGSLDVGFGTGGKVTTDVVGLGDYIAGIALQSDGKIVAAGTADTSIVGGDFAVARYSANGGPDYTFGVKGVQRVDLGLEDKLDGLAIQADDRIVVVGATSNAPGSFELARLTADGFVDTSFGTNGTVFTDFSFGGARAESVAIQADGRIVVGGDGFDLGSGKAVFVLARYSAGGLLDGSFGNGGHVRTAFPGALTAEALALQGDGKIVLAGSTDMGPSGDIALVRYENDHFQFAAPGYSVSENGGGITVTVQRTGGSTGTAAVVAAALGDTATAADFTPVAVLLTFNSGETSKTFTIPVNPDALVEGNETVLLQLSSPTNGASLGRTSRAVLTIVDAPPAVQNAAPPLLVLRGRLRYDAASRRWRQTLLIGNPGSQAVSGPLTLVLDGLHPSVKLRKQAGLTLLRALLAGPYRYLGTVIIFDDLSVYALPAPPGSLSRYLRLNDSALEAGAVRVVRLEFSAPPGRKIRYTPRVLAGAGVS